MFLQPTEKLLSLPPCVDIAKIRQASGFVDSIKKAFVAKPCYNTGRLAVVVIPIIITGGQWAVAKFSVLFPELSAKAGKAVSVIKNTLSKAWRLEKNGSTLRLVDANGNVAKTYNGNTDFDQFSEFIDDADNLPGSGTTVSGAGKVGLLSKLDNFTNLKTWVGNLDEVADASLISKIDNLATTNPSKLNQLDDLYNPSKFQMTAGSNRLPINSPAPFQASINGKTVNYNSQGFPDFKPHSAGSSFDFKSNSLTGTGSATAGDFKAANDWALSNPALSGKFQAIPGNQRCLVKFGDDWIECTWHHVQDGRTMFPVPSDVHNAFRHTGGKAIIERGLQDIFTY